MDASGLRRRVPREAVEAVLEALRADAPGPTRARRRSPHTRSRSCHLPASLRTWGFAVQLYALRSRASWGIGDLADLRSLARWARDLGAGMLLVNPFHAPLPRLPQEPSPYFPSSRLYGNPLYLRIEEVPGARALPQLAALAREGHALTQLPLVDRDRVFSLKRRALDALWERFSGDPDFDRFCAAEGETLERYAAFCVIAEERAEPWHRWPPGQRRPEGDGVARVLARQRRRADHHRWLQWLFDRQLARAAAELPLVQDVAVGFSPDGADAWLWQDCIAFGARVGAPPDEFSPTGQDWGLPPFDPHRLRAASYEPLARTFRRAMRHGGGIRVDHVMGLFRLWWIPPGAEDARGGAYVRYDADALLDILAAESVRADAYVVGEDLGTVADEIRAELRRRRVLSYRLGWFEERPPRRYPAQALAALTTHDLPTVAGVWTGDDLREMEESGREVNRASEQRVRERLARLARVADDAPVREVVAGAYTAMAAAPCRVVTATLDDACCAVRRPNIPGAMSRPNWSIPLPRTLEQLRRDALPRRIAAALAAR